MVFHVDGAVRQNGEAEGWMRTDLSATLFLCDPESYEGGELVIEDTYGPTSGGSSAGHLVLYPASSLHCVTPVAAAASARPLSCGSSRWSATISSVRAFYDLDRTIQSSEGPLWRRREVLSCSTCITTCCASGRKCDPLLMTEACGRQV